LNLSERESWDPPEVVGEQLRSEAARAIPQAEAALRPADKQTAREWLMALGVLVAGQMTTNDAKAKIGAYAPLLDHPACCFTRATLEEAGRQFKFFPAFAEIAAFLDEQRAPLVLMRGRLKAIAAVRPPESRQPRYSDLSAEQRAQLDEIMSRFRGSRTLDDGRLGEAPPRPIYVQNPELDAYVERARAEKSA
jgi:hypothetical protein